MRAKRWGARRGGPKFRAFFSSSSRLKFQSLRSLWASCRGISVVFEVLGVLWVIVCEPREIFVRAPEKEEEKKGRNFGRSGGRVRRRGGGGGGEGSGIVLRRGFVAEKVQSRIDEKMKKSKHSKTNSKYCAEIKKIKKGEKSSKKQKFKKEQKSFTFFFFFFLPFQE